MSKPPGRMSSAEFITLRQACGLTQADAAEFLGVKKRTVENWEYGIVAVSKSAGDALRNLDDLIRERATAVLRQFGGIRQEPRERVELIRYRTAEAYAAGEPWHVDAGLTMACYHAMLLRVIDGLARLGVRYLIRWSDQTT